MSRRLGWAVAVSLSLTAAARAHASGEPLTQRLTLKRPMNKRSAARSFESLVEMAPGARSDAYGVSIHGASSFENGYVVDGLSTQDPVLGINLLPLSLEFLLDFSVITGGYMAEYGHSTGGILRAWTRSGSNEFHGSLFVNTVPGFLGGTPTPTSGPTWTITGQDALGFQGDVGATLGGPILMNRLWFFAGVAPALTRVEHTRTLNARGPGASVSTPIPGSSRVFHAGERGLQAMGKLTYLFNYDHNLSLSVITTSTRSGDEDSLSLEPLTGGLREFINGSPTSLPHRELSGDFTTAALQYAGALMGKRLLLDARLGWSRHAASSLADGTGLTPLTFPERRPVTDYEPFEPDVALACGTDEAEQLSRCPVQYYEERGEELSTVDTVDRYQATAQAIYLMDLLGSHVVKAGLDAEHLSWEQLQRRIGFDQGNRYDSNTLGGFVQDSWTFTNRFTLNTGVRFDAQWLHAAQDPRTFVLGQQFSPRVGLVVDPLANGRMKLFAQYAKYRGQVPLGLLDGVAFSSSGHEPVDPELVPPSSTELVAGTEWEVLANIRLLANYTHRGLDSVVESLDRGDGVNPTFLGNPGMGLARDFPKAERTHDAVTVAMEKGASDDWMLQASYTWSRLHGNYVGPFRPRLDWGEPTLRSDFTFPSQLANRSGPLPNDRTHSIKVLGAKEFALTRALSAILGLTYRGQSGTPINYLGGHPEAGMGETFVLPRGSSGERTPWVHTIDARLGVSVQLARDKVVSLSLEAFNLFNFQAVTRVNEHYTYAPVLPLETGVDAAELTPDRVRTVSGQPLSEANPEFLKPTQYQAPRQVRLGLRYTF